jgi:Zn-dependent protease/CBS domain-containing protein
MTESLRLGRIAGVRVGVNWSVLVVFFLVTTALAGGRFPDLYPDLPGAAYAVAGVTAGIAFFASLLAHELAHAVVARHHGVRVEGITLWLLGGVARLEGEAHDAAADLRIAAAGPLTSVGLALAFLGVRGLLSVAGFHGLALGVLEWLALINVVLAAFNLVPAAPLDGGRILRALLWRRHGDRTRAAVTATHAGQRFGWLLLAVGVVDLVLGLGLGGLWLMLVGWFVATAAAAEERQAVTSAALADVPVAAVMSPDPTVVAGDIDVQTFLDRYVLRHHHSTFPLVDEAGRAVGLVTLRRVKQVPAGERPRTPLRAVAAPLSEVPLAAPDDRVTDLLPRMAGAADGRALVVAGGHVVGIVSPADIVRQLEVASLRAGSSRRITQQGGQP